MRFIHTADWQVGMRAKHVGEKGHEVREQRFTTARRVIEVAREQRADFILIAGDVFENNAVDPVSVRKVADILATFVGPVYVLPGNHDPLEPASIWHRDLWGEVRNVCILREAAPVETPGGTLFPCPARERHGGADPTAWIPAAGDGIRVGIAHGTVEGIETDEPEFPIPRTAAEKANLDYLALGHWHSAVTTYTDSAGATRMAYSGTPEPTRFGERDSGNVLLVEIDAHAAAPRVTPIRTAGLSWTQFDCAVLAPEDLSALRRAIDVIGEPGRTLIDLRITGLLAPETMAELRGIEEILAARFLFHRVDAAGLHPLPDDPNWVAMLPQGLLREAAAHLQKLSDPALAGPHRETASAVVATRALIELCALAQEIGMDVSGASAAAVPWNLTTEVLQ